MSNSSSTTTTTSSTVGASTSSSTAPAASHIPVFTKDVTVKYSHIDTMENKEILGFISQKLNDAFKNLATSKITSGWLGDTIAVYSSLGAEISQHISYSSIYKTITIPKDVATALTRTPEQQAAFKTFFSKLNELGSIEVTSEWPASLKGGRRKASATKKSKTAKKSKSKSKSRKASKKSKKSAKKSKKSSKKSKKL